MLQTWTPPGSAASLVYYMFGPLRPTGLPLPGLCGSPLSVDAVVVLRVPGRVSGAAQLVLQLPPVPMQSAPGQAVELVPSSGRVCLGNTLWVEAK